MEYFIYGLADSRRRAVRYIGITNNLKRRLAMHFATRNTTATPCGMWLRELDRYGLRPTMVILKTIIGEDEYETMRAAERAERRLIRQHVRQGGASLLNVTHGHGSRRSASQKALCVLDWSVHEMKRDRLSRDRFIGLVESAIRELTSLGIGV